MSVCQPLPIPSIPSIPAIFTPIVGAPTVTINYGTPGVTCCSGQIPGFQLQLPLPVPSLGTIMMALAPVLLVEIQAGLAILDEIQLPVCLL